MILNICHGQYYGCDSRKNHQSLYPERFEKVDVEFIVVLFEKESNRKVCNIDRH